MFYKVILLLLTLLYSPLSFGEISKPDFSIYQPVFLIGEKNYYAGKGFFLKFDDKAFFVTVHHIFGPLGGYEEDYQWDEMDEYLSLKLLEYESLSEIKVGPGIPLEGAKTFEQNDFTNDVAVFNSEGSFKGKSAKINTELPDIGDSVWLYTAVSSKIEYFHAKIVVSDSKGVIYVYDDPNVKIQATSGAPIINEKSEVVAVNLGGGNRDGKVIGFGNPVGVIVKKLEHSLN